MTKFFLIAFSIIFCFSIAVRVHAATTYTLTGPSTGGINVASNNFTVTPNSAYTGTVTVTPSGGGLSSPIVLTFSSSASPQTFTITPTAVGTVTLTPTNNGALTDPANVSFVASTVAPWTQIFDDNFNRANTAYNATTNSTSVGSPSIFASPSTGTAWSDQTGNRWKILNNQLVFNAASGATVLTSRLLRPQNEAALNQRVDLTTGIIASSTESYVIFLRQQANGNGMYVKVNSGTGIDVNYNNSGGSVSIGTLSYAMTTGHQYIISATAVTPVVNTTTRSPFFITVTIADTANPTVIVAKKIVQLPLTVNDGTLQPLAYTSGTMGVGSIAASSLSAIARVQYYQLTDPLLIGPTYIATSSSGNTVQLYNSSANWTPGTPGSPTFTVSGVSGVSIASQKVLSSSYAQLTLTTGSTAGTIAITDGTGNSALLDVSAPTGDTPTFYNTGYEIPDTPTTVKIPMDTPRGGQAPYTYQWFRSRTSTFASSTTLTGQTSLTLTDTPPDNKPYYYKITATDSFATPHSGSVTMIGRTNYTDSPTVRSLSVTNNVPALKIGLIGDSISTDFYTVSTNFIADLRAANVGSVTETNRAIAGTRIDQWNPGNATGYYDAAKTAFLAAGVNYVTIMFGYNDASGSLTQSTYQTALQSIVSDLGASGIKVIINTENYYYDGRVTTASDLMVQYSDTNEAVVAANTNTIQGDKNAFIYTANRTPLTVEGIHPNTTAAVPYAKYQADNFLSYLQTTFPTVSTYTLTGPSSGSVNAASSNFTVTPNGPYTGTVTVTPSGGGLSTPIVLTFSSSATPQTFTITPTTVGTVTLTPTNNGSLTDPSSLSYASNAVVPGAPTSVTAVAGNAQATVAFTAPASNGGATITGYTVTSIPSGGTDTNAGTTSLSHIITGLTNGTPYTFTTTATNSAGTSVASSQSNSVTPAVPGATGFTFTGPSAGNINSTSTAFTIAPNNPYTGTITLTPSGGGLSTPIVLTFGGTASSQTFTITPTAVGTVTLTPTNNGSLNNPSALLYSSMAIVPGAPTSVSATAGNAQATVSFTAPTSNGGATITSYTVTSIPTGGIDSNAGSTLLSHTITGLTNGTPYTFTATATNSAGTSTASSPSNSVTPLAPIATMFTFTGPTTGSINSTSTNFIITPNDIYSGTITITPSGGGLSTPIILTFSSSAAPQTFNITPTATGTVTLTPTNNGVLTNPSNLSYTTTAIVPGAATSVSATAGNAQATVSFNAPTNTGGTVITGYTVTSTPSDGTDTNTGSTALTHIITGLSNGTPYTFMVTATNSAGTSVASTPSNSITPAAPTVTPSITNTSGPLSGGGGRPFVPSIIIIIPDAPATSTGIATTTIKLGTASPQVKTLQQYLNSHGFTVAKNGPGSPGHETATFGPATKAAVIKFQKAHGLKADGIVGAATRTALVKFK